MPPQEPEYHYNLNAAACAYRAQRAGYKYFGTNKQQKNNKQTNKKTIKHKRNTQHTTPTTQYTLHTTHNTQHAAHIYVMATLFISVLIVEC